MFPPGILFEKWSPKEVKDSNQSPHFNCKARKTIIGSKINSRYGEK